jgi:hypothetical protein
MLDDLIADLVTPQRSRPLSLSVAVLALFVPASLVIFLAKPSLYGQLGVNGVILLSLAISLPIVLLCFGICYTPLNALWRLQKMVAGQPLVPADMEAALKGEDPLEWPCLLTGAWGANLILFSIAMVAYFKPLRIGATLLLTAVVLLSVWVFLFIVSTVAYIWVERKWKAQLGELAQAEAALANAQAELARAQAEAAP